MFTGQVMMPNRKIQSSISIHITLCVTIITT